MTSIREAFWRAQRRRGWKLHKYFHHLSSSQALAFNLLFLLYPEVPSRMVATRRILGLPEDVTCRLDFEAVLDAAEGTNIDALICTADGTRTIVEIKLTERAFGAAPADERHLAKLVDIYGPRLAGRVASSCLEPSAFFRDYQLYRNLAQFAVTALIASYCCSRELARSCGSMPRPGANRQRSVRCGGASGLWRSKTLSLHLARIRQTWISTEQPSRRFLGSTSCLLATRRLSPSTACVRTNRRGRTPAAGL